MTGNRIAQAYSNWVTPYLSKRKKALARILALGIGAEICAAMLMFSAGYLISWSSTQPDTIFLALAPLVGVQAFGLGRPVLRYLGRLSQHDWVFRVTSDIRKRLFHIAAKSNQKDLDLTSGELLGTLSQNIGHLQELFLRSLFPLVLSWITLLLTSVFFGFFSLWFAGATLLPLLFCAVLSPLLLRRITRKTRGQRDKSKLDLYDQLTDDILGAEDLICSGRAQDRLTGYARQKGDVSSAEARISVAEHLLGFVNTLIYDGIVCAIVIWSTNGPGVADACLIPAFVLGFLPLVATFSGAGSSLAQAQTHTKAIVELDELPTPNEENGAPEAAQSLSAAGDASASIDIEGLTFTYDGSAKPALDNVSLHVPAGQHLAIIGRSGAGKSTFAETIKRAYDQQVTYLSQSSFLFARSLKENLLIAKPDATDEELESALKRVGLSDALENLPHGLDSYIGESGTVLSGGERHRIAIARTLLADRPIVILDEPASGLDPETEHALYESLFDVLSGKTLIVITHHLLEIERFDRVVLLDQGSIKLDGAPEVLAKENEHFRNLIQLEQASVA